MQHIASAEVCWQGFFRLLSSVHAGSLGTKGAAIAQKSCSAYQPRAYATHTNATGMAGVLLRVKESSPLPNTMCFPSSQEVTTVVMKNWLPAQPHHTIHHASLGIRHPHESAQRQCIYILRTALQDTNHSALSFNTRSKGSSLGAECFVRPCSMLADTLYHCHKLLCAHRCCFPLLDTTR